MSNSTKKVLLSLIVVLIIFITGYNLGRKTFLPQTVREVRWISGHIIRDTIEKPVPYMVEVPSDPQYIYIEKPGEPLMIDTNAIIYDWMLKRQYEIMLINNDTIGMCKLYADVQYNQLQETRYEFTPITKIVDTETYTETAPKLFIPFIMAGFSSNMMSSVGGGLFIKDIGISYEYIHKFSDEKFDAHALKLIYKF